MNKGYIVPNYIKYKALASNELANVYWVKNDTGQDFVLKQLKKKAAKNSRHKALFLAEAELLSQLKHPAIAAFVEQASLAAEPYFIMQYIAGVDLKAACLGENLNKIHYLFLQLLDVLHFLHQQNIFHLDLKPQNILVDTSSRPQIKLIDFGLATLSKNYEQLAEPDSMMGSAPYAAPEMIAGNSKPSAAADLYSLGVILFELLTNRYPFPGENIGELLANQLSGNTESVWSGQEQVWHGLANVISALLHSDSHDRPQNVKAVIEIINRAEGENYQLPFTELFDGVAAISDDVIKARKFDHNWANATQQLFEFYKVRENEKALNWIGQFWREEHFSQCGAMFLLEWARLLMDDMQFAEAEKLMARAQSLYTLASREAGFVHEINLKKNYYQRDTQTFYQHLELAEKLYQQANFRPGLIRLKVFAAMMAIRETNFDTATTLLAAASVMEAQMPHPYYQMMIASNEAVIALSLGDLNQAAQKYQSVLKVSQELLHYQSVAFTLNNLAKVYFDLGKIIESRHYALRAQQVALLRGYAYPEAVSLEQLAKVEERLANYPGQINYLSQAINRYLQTDLKSEYLRCTLARAYAYWAIDDFVNSRNDVELVLKQSSLLDAESTHYLDWLVARLASEGQLKTAEDPAKLLIGVVDFLTHKKMKAVLWQAYYDLGKVYANQHEWTQAKKFMTLAESAVSEYIHDLPEAYKHSFLRDRKHLKIKSALEAISKEQ